MILANDQCNIGTDKKYFGHGDCKLGTAKVLVSKKHGKVPIPTDQQYQMSIICS